MRDIETVTAMWPVGLSALQATRGRPERPAQRCGGRLGGGWAIAWLYYNI